MRAVGHAAFLVDQYHDNLILVTLGKNAGDKEKIYDRYIQKARDVALRCGVVVFRVFTEFVELPNGWKVEDALVHLADSTSPMGGTVLVLGAAGKDFEATEAGAKPMGQPPMGSLALACLEKCKQPVVLVKSGAAPSDANRIKRIGNDGTPGLNILICLDGSDVSRKAFDMALTFGTKGKDRKADSLFLYHVRDDTDPAKSKAITDEFSIMCALV